MFSASNPYDEIVIKATDENLASEDWALNMEVCDKVMSDGATGARNAVASLTKRLSHRNPNVQLYSLELANSLAQNCDKPLMSELSSRNWTSALERLVNDRATNAAVKKRTLHFIKAWAKQFEDTGDPNLGLMGELYDQLRGKNFTFDEPEPAPEDVVDARQRQEDEELARVLELSKKDKGGRSTYQTYQPSGSGGSSSSAAVQSSSQAPSRNQGPSQAQSSSYTPYQSSYATQSQAPAPAPAPVRAPEPEPAPLDMNSCARVRSLYPFVAGEVGELSFEKGDIIKVLDRTFKEWWRGACNGKIGIFPVTYVEALPEPTARELQEEAQGEARVFASLGLVDRLLQTLQSVDTTRGDRLDARPEVEQMYQDSVALQGQINALIKKYSDQKAELEHMNANFLKAMKQYEELRAPPQPVYAPPQHNGYMPHPAHGQQPPALYQQAQQHPHAPAAAFPSAHPAAAPAGLPAQSPDAYYAPQSQQPQQPQNGGHYPPQHQQPPHQPGQLQRAPTGAPSFPPQAPPRTNTEPGAAGMGAGADGDAAHKAAWDAYYRQQAEYAAQQQRGQGHSPTEQQHPQQHGPPSHAQPQEPGQVPYGQSPYPPMDGQGQPGQPGQGPYGYGHGAQQGQQQYAQGHSMENLNQGMGRMGVHG